MCIRDRSGDSTFVYKRVGFKRLMLDFVHRHVGFKRFMLDFVRNRVGFKRIDGKGTPKCGYSLVQL